MLKQKQYLSRRNINRLDIALMFSVGDIVKIYAPAAGYPKYHLCIAIGGDEEAFKFLFLNSDPNFRDTYSVNCSRVPCIPISDTGVTAFSFSQIPRYTVRHLSIYNATKLGELDKNLAQELLEFIQGVKSLSRSEKQIVILALSSLCVVG